MKKIINLNLYKKNRLENSYKNIKVLEKNNEYIFILEGVKTIVSSKRFARENEEFIFEINIKDKTATYLLKDNNVLLDIEVEKISYKITDNIIILEYKLSSDEDVFKIEIKDKEDNNE